MCDERTNVKTYVRDARWDVRKTFCRFVLKPFLRTCVPLYYRYVREPRIDVICSMCRKM